MMKNLNSGVCVLLMAVLLTLSGCQTVGDWWDGMFGSGDGVGEAEFIPGPVESDLPGGWGAPDEAPPLAAGDWAPIPGINFPPVYFAYDQFRIGASERAKLEQVANYLLQHRSVGLIIEGHCDERGSLEYNRSLGERRAIAVRDYLVNLGISDARLQTISYGEERPSAQGSGESIWAKNRRAELIAARMN